jgi:hypothetical protein
MSEEPELNGMFARMVRAIRLPGDGSVTAPAERRPRDPLRDIEDS